MCTPGGPEESERGESLRTHSYYRCHGNSIDATERRKPAKVSR